jgi:hypothetical protein
VHPRVVDGGIALALARFFETTVEAMCSMRVATSCS